MTDTLLERLTVIADERAHHPPRNELLLRFAGIPLPGETSPAGVHEIRDLAAAELKAKFGPWLFRWMRDTGGLSLERWEGGLSWWWYAPLSERSALRGDLVLRTHQLMVFREVLRRYQPARISWFDSIPEMRDIVVQLAEEYGCQCEFILCGQPHWRRRMGTVLLLRLYAFVAEILRYLVFRLSAPPPAATRPSPQVIFMTRFPILWETENDRWRERMYGRLPALFEARGQAVAYAASISGSLWGWYRLWQPRRRAMRRFRICPLHIAGGISDIVAVHSLFGFWRRYRRWRRSLTPKAATFDGLDITPLLRRELDFAVMDPDISGARLIARNLPKLLAQWPEAKFVIHPFEYQPIEKATAIGASIGRRAMVIALQTGVFTSGQLGFLPNPEEIRTIDNDVEDGTRAPLPDLLITYGSLMSRLYEPVMGPGRTLEAGALRYGALAARLNRKVSPHVHINRVELDAPHMALVACPSMAEEAWPIVRAAITLAQKQSNLRLAFKFHYHLRIDKAVAELAQLAIPSRWDICDTQLHDLIETSDVVVTGATSVAYESLAMGLPTLVYAPTARWHSSPAAETPEAFMFWHDEQELISAYLAISAGSHSVPDHARQSALDQQLKLKVGSEDEVLCKLLGTA